MHVTSCIENRRFSAQPAAGGGQNHKPLLCCQHVYVMLSSDDVRRVLERAGARRRKGHNAHMALTNITVQLVNQTGSINCSAPYASNA